MIQSLILLLIKNNNKDSSEIILASRKITLFSKFIELVNLDESLISLLISKI